MDKNKDLIIKEISNSPLVKKEYKVMLDNIHNTLPAIKQSISNFDKRTEKLSVEIIPIV